MIHLFKRYQQWLIIFMGGCLFASPIHALFTTLDELVQYAQTLEEYPKPSNNNLLKPDFTDLLKAQSKSSFMTYASAIATKLHLKQPDAWTIEACMQLMNDITETYITTHGSGSHIALLPNTPDSRYIIWGDLKGSLHSLVRTISYLRDQEIIDNEFRIVQPNTFFIFNGNAIDRSPYSLATITVLMRILQKNPKNALYIQGHHEQKNVWPNHALADELRIRGARFSHSNELPFFDTVIKFFDILPLAVYIPSKNADNSPSFIRISNLTREETEDLDESHYHQFFLQPISELTTCNLALKSAQRAFIDIRACIVSKSTSLFYQKTDGLELITPDQGATTWIQLSCPNFIYQTLFDFHYDAFTILTTNDYVGQSTITLHKQDLKTMTGFTASPFNLITGATATNNMFNTTLARINTTNTKPDKGNEIVIGMLTDFSERQGFVGQFVRDGTAIKIDQVNIEQHGIKDKRIRLVILDDQANQYVATNKIQRLLNDYKTDLIISPHNVPTINACMPFVKSGNIALLFSLNGSRQIRDHTLTSCVNYRTSYDTEVKALINYAVNNRYLKNFALVYQDDLYSGVLATARTELAKYPDTHVIEVAYTPHSTYLEPLLKKIQNNNIDAIVFLANNASSTTLVQNLGVPYMFGKQLFGISALSNSFSNFLLHKGLFCTFSRTVPNPVDPALIIAQEYREHLQKYAPEAPLSTEGFEAYINISLLVEVMEKIKGEITKEKIIAAFEKMNNYPFKGLHLTFDPTTRELIAHKQIWVDTQTAWLPYKTYANSPTPHTTPPLIQPQV